MKNKLLYGLIVLFVLGILPVCHAQTTLTLKQCLDYGLVNSPSIKAADYAVAALEENRKSARADFLPSLSTSYSLTRLENISSKGAADTDYLNQDMRTFALRLSQVLYAGNRLLNAYDKAKLDMERKAADRRLAELELSYNIQATFFQLKGAELNVKILKEAVVRLEEGVKSANAYLEKSLISYSEVLSARVDLADAEQQLSKAKNDVNRKRVALFSLMNHPISEEVVFEGGLEFFAGDYPSEFEACWHIAKSNRPDLESLAKQVAMSEKDAAIALGSYLPLVKLDLGYNDQNRDYESLAAYNYDRDQRNRYWSAGVNASWELFDGGRSWYQNQKSSLDVLQIKENIKKVQLSIQEGIRKALFSISEAEHRTRGALGAVGAAEENYKVESSRLEAGLTTVPLLLDAQIRLTRAQGNYTQALLDYQLSRSELEFMIGEKEKKDK